MLVLYSGPLELGRLGGQVFSIVIVSSIGGGDRLSVHKLYYVTDNVRPINYGLPMALIMVIIMDRTVILVVD